VCVCVCGGVRVSVSEQVSELYEVTILKVSVLTCSLEMEEVSHDCVEIENIVLATCHLFH
jgi:hypothetical protein